ncbi:hypothetical protein PSTT_09442, partial [Puccinia striiformis]
AQIQLAFTSTLPAPILLPHFTSVYLSVPASRSLFSNVHLIIGLISGDHDVILGTPCLNKFDVRVSLKCRQILSQGFLSKIHDYCVPENIAGISIPSPTTPFPYTEREANFLTTVSPCL